MTVCRPAPPADALGGRRPLTIPSDVDHASAPQRRDAAPPPECTHDPWLRHGAERACIGFLGDRATQAMAPAVACDALLTRYSERQCSGICCATVSQLYTFPSISAQPEVRTSM